MRILLTSSGHWGTGSFTAIDSIIPQLMKRGHEVRVFMPEPPFLPSSVNTDGRPLELYERWKFPLDRGDLSLRTFPLIIPDPHPNNPDAFTYKELTPHEFDYFFQELSIAMQRVIDRFNPDIIECNHIWAMAYVVSMLKMPYIVTAHNSDQMGFEYDERMRSYAIEAAEHAKYVIAISEKNKMDVERLYGVNPNKIFIIPNSYDPHVFKPMKLDRAEVLRLLGLDIPESATIVNLTGKISRTKGVDVLLQANRFLQKDSRNIHLLILGAGEFKGTLDPEKAGTYCFDNVHRLGHVSQDIVAKVHSISKLSVVASRTEGFPIACTEAMGCAKPVVITDLGGSEKRAVGMIVPQENPRALAEAILGIIQLEKQHYDTLCEKALNAAQSYTWEQNVEERLNLYQN